jgi:hypothetical protein
MRMGSLRVIAIAQRRQPDGARALPTASVVMRKMNSLALAASSTRASSTW